MNRFLLILSLVLVLPAQPGCTTAPSARVVQVQTLGTIGAGAKAALDTATQLLKAGTITVAQWQTIANFYDAKFQPAYNLAVAAVSADLTSIANPDVVALSAQFLQLVAQLTTH